MVQARGGDGGEVGLYDPTVPVFGEFVGGLLLSERFDEGLRVGVLVDWPVGSGE